MASSAAALNILVIAGLALIGFAFVSAALNNSSILSPFLLTDTPGIAAKSIASRHMPWAMMAVL